MNLPTIPGLPKLSEIRITDPIEVSVFSLGNAAGFLAVYLLTGDDGLAAYLAPVIGTILWAVWRLNSAASQASRNRRRQEEEQARQYLISRVKFELGLLEPRYSTGDLNPGDVDRLYALRSIEQQQLYNTRLMCQVLGIAEPIGDLASPDVSGKKRKMIGG